MDARQLALQGAQVMTEARCWSAVAAISSNFNAARRSRFDSTAWLSGAIATTMEQTRLCHAGTADGNGEHGRKNKSTHRRPFEASVLDASSAGSNESDPRTFWLRMLFRTSCPIDSAFPNGKDFREC
jgi:hypothetical protein